ncbi:hexose transporter [Apiospora saccharicola]|uniref:Hexose transporter n=1 Tax=Apiospora saccharicola TaxID=335842 RepID=A0ABR1U225_9PEZI
MWCPARMDAILGAPAMHPIFDSLDHKKGILLASLIAIVGVMLQDAAQHIAMSAVTRIVVGFGSAISNAPAPVLLAELLPARARGRVLGIFFSCFYVWSLAAWRLPSLLKLIPSFLAICLLPSVFESPRWLTSKGQDAHARVVLAIMQGQIPPDAMAETAVRDIKAVMQKEEEACPRNAWRELLATPPNRRRLLVLVTFGTMISTLGNFVISYYLARILDQAGVTDTNTQLQISVGLNCWCFLVAMVGSFMLDVLGRRQQALISIAGMIVCLFVIGGMIKAYGQGDNAAGIYSTITVIVLLQGFYSFAIPPMTSLYPSEI